MITHLVSSFLFPNENVFDFIYRERILISGQVCPGRNIALQKYLQVYILQGNRNEHNDITPILYM